MARATPVRPLLDERLTEMLSLMKGADSVELKLTVPDEPPVAVQALGIDPLDVQMRQVFFFDTPDLKLDSAGLVVRGRASRGARGDDSVVKLRPVKPADLRRRVPRRRRTWSSRSTRCRGLCLLRRR